MTESCALDIADRGPVTLEYIASVQAITRERVRQIELTAMANMQAALAKIMAGDDDIGVRAQEVVDEQNRLNALQSKDIEQLRESSRAARGKVFDWLSDIGAPPID